jgi:hypothetical protein
MWTNFAEVAPKKYWLFREPWLSNLQKNVFFEGP